MMGRPAFFIRFIFSVFSCFLLPLIYKLQVINVM